MLTKVEGLAQGHTAAGVAEAGLPFLFLWGALAVVDFRSTVWGEGVVSTGTPDGFLAVCEVFKEACLGQS